MNTSRGSFAATSLGSPSAPAAAAAALATLVVDLQARGLRVEVPLERRTGGAGPSDSGMLWVGGFPLTVPTDNLAAAGSPYVLEGRGRRLCRFRGRPTAGRGVHPATTTFLRPDHGRRHPVLEDRPDAPGLVREHRRADVLLLGQLRPVHVLRDRVSLDPGRTIVKKTPRAARRGRDRSQGPRRRGGRDAHHRQLQRRRPWRPVRRPLRCTRSRRPPVCRSGAVRAADGPRRDRRGGRPGHRLGGHPRRVLRPRGARAGRPGQGPLGHRGLLHAPGSVPSRAFGEGQVSTYVILGMGEDPELTVEGCRRAIDLGVYPFVVPLRPVAGSLMEDVVPPSREYAETHLPPGRRLHARARACRSERRKAGCARCQACSGPAERRGPAADRPGGPGSPMPSELRPENRPRLTPASGPMRRPQARCVGGPVERASVPTTAHPARRLRRRAGACSRVRPDAHDDDAATIARAGLDDGLPRDRAALPAGSTALWQGDRLAVLPGYRHSGGLGASLVRYAVATAGALGGERMVAQIQLGNVRVLPAARLDRGRRAGRLRSACRTSRCRIAAAERPDAGIATVRDPHGGLTGEAGDTGRRQVEDVDHLGTAAQPHPAGVVDHADRRGGEAALGERRQACAHPRRRAAQQEREAREAAEPVGDERRRRAPGTRSRSTVTPSRPGSSSMANEPTSPAMLTSLAATATSSAASSASSRTSPASREPRSSNDGKNGKSARIAPVDAAATISYWPGAAFVVDSTRPPHDRPRRPTAPAGRRAGEVTAGERHVVPGRLPAASRAAPRGTPPRCRRSCRATPTGRAPIAARSLTLVSTAATPAPYGSAATKAGRIASPQATTWPAPRRPR